MGSIVVSGVCVSTTLWQSPKIKSKNSYSRAPVNFIAIEYNDTKNRGLYSVLFLNFNSFLLCSHTNLDQLQVEN